MKKLARLIDVEECDVEPDKIKSVFENKTLIKKINNCKPFIGVSIFISLYCNNINWNNDLFLFKVKK